MGGPVRCGRSPGRGILWPTVLAMGLAVLCVLGPALSTGHGAVPALPSGSNVPPAVATLGGSPFASRAGYAPSYAADVPGAQPLTGTVRVDVTFDPTQNGTTFRSATAYFRGEGLDVTSSDPALGLLGLEGPAKAVGSAFGTELLGGSYEDQAVQFPATPPTLPAALESAVAGVVGLSSGFTTFSFDLSAAPATSTNGSIVPDASNTMTPALARQLYNLSGLYALRGGANYPTNESIAVILWGAGYDPTDLSTFFSTDYPSTFPAPKYLAYNLDGASPPGPGALSSNDTDAVEELTLDIEWAESFAPGATVDAIYVPAGPPPSYSPSTVDLTNALQEAFSLNVSVISMSFGTTESTDSSLVSAWTPLLQKAESDNITVLAATGDSGGDTTLSPSGICSGTAAPEYPASSPAVIAVGGTNVTIDRNPLGQVEGFNEAGWLGSGGGFSTQFAAPSWQEVGSASGPISANGHRGFPDVSATAADDLLYFDHTNATAEGTSFATPLWAGVIADLDATWGHRLGFVTPRLYHVGANEPSGQIGIGLADITNGSNCVASAGPGWDEVTGWGSPRAPELYYDLLGSFVTIALDLGSGATGPGGTFSVAAQVTNRSTGLPIPDLTVNLSTTADTNIGPCDGNADGTLDSASPTTNQTGWVSASLSVPWCYLGQHAFVNASVTTVKLYGEVGARVAVNLLGFFPSLEVLSQPPWVYVTFSGIVGAAAVVGAWIGRPRDSSFPPTRRAPLPPPPPGTGAPTGPVPPLGSGPPVPSPPPSPPTSSPPSPSTPPGSPPASQPVAPPPSAPPPAPATPPPTSAPPRVSQPVAPPPAAPPPAPETPPTPPGSPRASEPGPPPPASSPSTSAVRPKPRARRRPPKPVPPPPPPGETS